MKKYQMLEKAMKDYPKGTKFISLFGCEIESSGSFFIDGTDSVAENPSNCNVHDSETGKWAEIVKPKIAVRVENEKEFNALMKYYDSLGWKWCNNYKPLEYDPIGGKSNTKAIPFHDKFDNGIVSMKLEQGYRIIPFSDFAKEHNIKLPLLTSEDGVDLYEGDEFYIVENLELSKWDVTKHKNHHDRYVFITDALSFPLATGKPFSTKQSALDWIESQKPKEIEYVSNFGIKCQSSKDEVLLNCGCGCFSLTKKDIESIHKAMQELS